MKGIVHIPIPPMRHALRAGMLIEIIEDISKGEHALITNDPIANKLILHKYDHVSDAIKAKGKFSCSCGKYGRYKYLGQICDNCKTEVKKID